MSFETTKDFWDNQASKFTTGPEATTGDFYMREIEIRCLGEKIKQLENAGFLVADIGCGNGFSTLKLAEVYPEIHFHGYDYSTGMIENAIISKKEANVANIQFNTFDLTKDELKNEYDLIYTDRCLINLPSWEDQKIAIDKIYNALNANGTYLMIENFMDGQENFNKIRREFGLNEINVRDHNLFFDKEELLIYLKGKFKVVEYVNISSQYYITSRVIYSAICKDQDIEPDYYDIHHKLGSKLPFDGNNGPISMFQLKKI